MKAKYLLATLGLLQQPATVNAVDIGLLVNEDRGTDPVIPPDVPTVTGGVTAIWLDGDWVTTDAVTVFDAITPPEKCREEMYDRRDGQKKVRNAWCFQLTLSDQDKIVEIHVNREFWEEDAA